MPRRVTLAIRQITALLAVCVLAAGVGLASAQAGSPSPAANRLIALRGGHFGGFHFGHGLTRRRRAYTGFGRPYSRRPSLLHRIARALALAYILHLLFTHGGLSILVWILIIIAVISLFRLHRRRRRYAY